MKNSGLCELRAAFSKWIVIHALTLSVLFLSGAAAAQQRSEADAGVGQRSDDTQMVAQNNEESGAPNSSGQSTQVQKPLPDTPSASQAPSRNAFTLTLGERFDIYRHAILRPYSVVGPALGAGIGQWEDEPPGWGQGGQGYGRRIASGMGRQLISETIRFGVAAADGEDPRYQRSNETGVWNRARYAIVETFTSRTSSGARIPAYSRFAGIYGAAFIANTWYPDNRATAGYALRRGSTALGSSVGFHLFEEFVPRKYFKLFNGKE